MIAALSNLFIWIYIPEAWLGLLTLVLLEIVLSIDNIVFLSIIIGKLPGQQQDKARKLGLLLAMIMRLLLLMSISWIMGLTHVLFTLFKYNISWRDLILILGGIFLILKSSHEIFTTVEMADDKQLKKGKVVILTFGSAIAQIVALDIIFSLDSVITAVGMIQYITIMMIAVVIAVGVMFISAKPIGDFINRYPSIKILALAFLIMIGIVLTAEGFGYILPKTFVYCAMALCVLMQMLNIRRDKNVKGLGECPTCGSSIRH
ncbi:MAG: TerC family protein [Psychromonas sp.]|nr:TerC family protein [Psychromonas sp.]